MPTLTTYLAHAPLDVVQPLVEQVFTEAGWRVASAPTEGSPQAVRLSARCGSLLRTLLLGGGAGDGFYLHHQLLLTPVAGPSADLPLLEAVPPGTGLAPGTAADSAGAADTKIPASATTASTAGTAVAATATITRIDYPTAGAKAINRGGIFGVEREARSHDQLSKQVVVVLRTAGIEVGCL